MQPVLPVRFLFGGVVVETEAESEILPRNSLGNGGNGFDAVMPAQSGRSSGMSSEGATSFMPATFPPIVIANSMISLPCLNCSVLENCLAPPTLLEMATYLSNILLEFVSSALLLFRRAPFRAERSFRL